MLEGLYFLSPILYIFTFGPVDVEIAFESASHARIREISWTSVLTWAELADADRSWLSLACKLGCVETWTFDGRDMVTKCEWQFGYKDDVIFLAKFDFERWDETQQVVLEEVAFGEGKGDRLLEGSGGGAAGGTHLAAGNR